MESSQGYVEEELHSSVIAVVPHCPLPLRRSYWSVEQFALHEKIYESPLSVVWRAVDRHSGITVALKAYKRALMGDVEKHQAGREIWLHAQISHPSVISLFAAWKDSQHIYLALEWAESGTVSAYLNYMGGVLDERAAVSLVLEPTISALAHIHSLGMIHRDVKPQNILMTHSMQIKIADFGLSISQSYEVANSRLGTIDYIAPEVVDCPIKSHPLENKVNPEQHYSNKVDVWSVGVMAYEMLTGSAPFEACTPVETLRNIRFYEPHIPPTLSSGASDFIAQALRKDPLLRPSMQELLHHPWLQSLNHSQRRNLSYPSQ